MALSGWSHRIKLTIDGTVPGLSGSIIGICKVGIPAALKAVCQSNGEDLRITSSDEETLLDYGIEKWSATNPVVHFRHTLIGVGDTEVYAYGGNIGASDNQNKPNVAQDDVGYWTLGDAGPDYAYDWTVYGNTAERCGGVTFGQTGKIGDACLFNGSDGKLDIGKTPSQDTPGDITLLAWCKSHASGSFVLGDMSGQKTIYTFPLFIINNTVHSNLTFHFNFVDGGGWLTDGPFGLVIEGVWQHFACWRNTSALTSRAYIDGAAGNLSDYSGASNPTVITQAASNDLAIGYLMGMYGNGEVDNIRVLTEVLSENEIIFDAYSYPSSSMFSWGELEEVPSASVSNWGALASNF